MRSPLPIFGYSIVRYSVVDMRLSPIQLSAIQLSLSTDDPCVLKKAEIGPSGIRNHRRRRSRFEWAARAGSRERGTDHLMARRQGIRKAYGSVPYTISDLRRPDRTQPEGWAGQVWKGGLRVEG